MNLSLRVLAVADPAMFVYRDPQHAMLEKFSQQTGVQVQFDLVPWAEFFDQLLCVFRGEIDYDIVTVAGHLWLKDFVDKGYLLPLNFDTDNILDAVAREIQYRGQIFLSPSFCDGHMILFRPSMIPTLASQDLQQPLSTRKFAKLIEAAGQQYGHQTILQKAHASEIFLDALPYFWDEDCSLVDDSGQVSDLLSPASEAALERYLQLRQFAPVASQSAGNDEVREAFQTKSVPLVVTWCGQLGRCLDSTCQDQSDIGFATLTRPFNVTWSFAVSAKSKHPDEARQLLDYLRSAENDLLVGRFSGAPVLKSTYDQDADRFAWYGQLKKMINQDARALPAIANAGEIWGHFYRETHLAYCGQKTARQALEAIAEAIQQQGVQQQI